MGWIVGTFVGASVGWIVGNFMGASVGFVGSFVGVSVAAMHHNKYSHIRIEAGLKK